MATVFLDHHDRTFTPNFGTFISLWTLSLAPLIAHIVAGVPQRVYLVQARPSLLDRLVHLNPTSILWRYFAILDRRIRAKSWDRAMLATTNALFWTEHGWHGDEEMLSRSRPHLVRLPKESHVEVLSASFAQTIVVTLQGVQALYELVSIKQFGGSPLSILPAIFLPLALFGLVRLPAAYWLIEEHTFVDVTDDSSHPKPSERQTSSSSTSTQFYPASSWRGVLVRVFFLVPTFGMAALAFLYLSLTHDRNFSFSATGVCMIITYVFFTLTTAVLVATNIIRGASRTTVLPGIGSTWYKLYTCLLFFMAAVMFVFASVEQVQPLCESAQSCPGFRGLGDFSVTFNASSNTGLWTMGGNMNASYIFVTGKYTGFTEGFNSLGSFNESL